MFTGRIEYLKKGLSELVEFHGADAVNGGEFGIAKLFGVGCDHVCCEFQAVISRV